MSDFLQPGTLNIVFTFTGVPGLNNAYYHAIKETTKTAKSPLSRGHMNPAGLNKFDREFRKATFTFSNAVPQFKISNGGPWQKFEKRISKYAKQKCGPRGGTLYLLTGKSDNGVSIQRGIPRREWFTPLPYLRNIFPANVKLVTPRAVWTAGCCVWPQPGNYFAKVQPVKRAESFAVMSNNKDDADLLYQTEVSVSTLEMLLTRRRLRLREVDLFPGNEDCRRAQNNIKLDP